MKTRKWRLTTGVVVILMANAVGYVPVEASEAGSRFGVLVLSTGTVGKRVKGFSYYIYYRRLPSNSSCRAASADTETISLKLDIWSGRPFDFTGHETGQVLMLHLEPGSYEICNYRTQDYYGLKMFSSGPPPGFSIPFSISPNESTYLGDFAVIRKEHKNWWGDLEPAGADIVVSDKHERDIPIALKLEPDLPPVNIQVPDVSKLNASNLLPNEP